MAQPARLCKTLAVFAMRPAGSPANFAPEKNSPELNAFSSKIHHPATTFRVHYFSSSYRQWFGIGQVAVQSALGKVYYFHLSL